MRKRIIDKDREEKVKEVEEINEDRIEKIGLGEDKGIEVEIVIVLRVWNRRIKSIIEGKGDKIERESKIGKWRIKFIEENNDREKVKIMRDEEESKGEGFRIVIIKMEGRIGIENS